MDFDRARADKQPLGDIRIGRALGDQLQNFALADSQIEVGIARPFVGWRLVDGVQ